MSLDEIKHESIRYFKSIGFSLNDKVLYYGRKAVIVEITGWRTIDDLTYIKKEGFSPYAVIKYKEPYHVSNRIFTTENCYGSHIQHLTKT